LAIKKGLKMFVGILPSFITVLILVSLLLAWLPQDMITHWLGKSSGLWAYPIAAIAGSIFLIPAFIAYPLGGLLIRIGVSYSVIAIFITTLMMVGIITLPLEAKYFGWKVAVTRNVFSFIAAIIIGLAIGVIWRFV
jgi:uncharacterized membrane protein YraQ (UPF0718 family)